MAIEGLDLYRRQFELEQQAQFAGAVRGEKQKIGLALLAQVDLLTPVNLGDARRAWHFSSGRQSGEDREPSGGDAAAELLQLTNEAAPTDALYLQNHAPHITVIDQGKFEHDTPPGGSRATHVPESRRHLVRGKILVQGGFSVQAPQGIGGKAVDQVAADLGLQRTAGG